MTTRRRFTSDFKAKVALEALRGDRTIQVSIGTECCPPIGFIDGNEVAPAADWLRACSTAPVSRLAY